MKKRRLALLLLPVLLLAGILWLAFARPTVRVEKTIRTDGGACWNVVAVARSFRAFQTSPGSRSVEKWEDGEWKPCGFVPGEIGEMIQFHMISLNIPGQKAVISKDIGSVYDLSSPGRYRVSVDIYPDGGEAFIIFREFTVRASDTN